MTSRWPLILTSKWQLRPPVTFDWFSSARYGFLDTTNLWKDTHKSNTVDFNNWTPVDLQFWPSKGRYDLQWHLSSILLQDMDLQIQKNLWKDVHKSNLVDLNVWPPVDLQFWPSNGSYDLQWYLSSILVPDFDSQIQKKPIKRHP